MKNLTVYGASLNHETSGQPEILTLAVYRALDTQDVGPVDHKADAAGIADWLRANLPHPTYYEIARLMS